MSKNQCENCSGPITESQSFCQVCDYPQKGTKAEKIKYNVKLLRLKDLLEDSDKSVQGILSFGIIFIFMAVIVLAFSFIFKENHYTNVLAFGAVGLVYFMLYHFGKRYSYLVVVLSLLFCLGHTIFEFSNSIFPKSPIDLDKSFLESRGTSLFFELIPLAYIIFRLTLMIVLVKYFWIQLKLKKDEKKVNFIKSKKQQLANTGFVDK